MSGADEQVQGRMVQDQDPLLLPPHTAPRTLGGSGSQYR